MSTRPAVAILFALFFATALPAQFVAPISYTTTPAEGTAVGGSWDYFDAGGAQLTDGSFGIDNWSADLGHGNAYEWVGWYTTGATLIFNFSQTVTLSAVTLGLARHEAAGIYIPPSLTIGAETFTLAGEAFGDFTRADLTFTLAQPVIGNQLTISVQNPGGRWVFVDEVRFAATVPEPSTLALLGCGLGFSVLFHQRTRRWAIRARRN